MKKAPYSSYPLASEGARRGAGMGAVVGSGVGLAGFGVAALVAQQPLDEGARVAIGVAALVGVVAATSVGAAIGAVVGNEARGP